MKCSFEIYYNRQWHHVGEMSSLGGSVEIARGHRGCVHFTYDEAYAVLALGAQDYRALSCRYPVDLGLHTTKGWPAFVLDLIPAGAARRALLDVLALADDDGADWPLLLHGTSHPPGNIRVRGREDSTMERELATVAEQPGFTRDQVMARNEDFIEYAYRSRSGVAGTSGAHGEAPKFLLTEGADGLLYADGILPDARARRHWLVKWPRGNKEADSTVLRNEAAYMRVAETLGLTVFAQPEFQQDTLFVPRFDRVVVGNGEVKRYGLESLYSLAGVTSYGARVPMEILAAALTAYSTDPGSDLTEWVVRDVVNVALGNTDNHGRNSAVLKTSDGQVRLSPLYDFAPMILDPAGIARNCRWTGAEKDRYPDWRVVIGLLEDKALLRDTAQLRRALQDLAGALEHSDVLLRQCGVDEEIIERLELRIAAVRDGIWRALR